MIVRGAQRLVVVCAFVLGLTFVAEAQTASLNGTVIDASGGVVPKATVVAQMDATNIERESETTATGVYSLPNLVPGIYNITIRKTGFRTIQFLGVALTIDQTLTVDARLVISPTSQTITVAGQDVAPIDTTNAEISNIVQEQQMMSLPLITRDPYELVLLSPGEIQSNTRLGGFSTNGQREQNNNFLVDGVDNNDTDVPGAPGGLIGLNPDSAKEFRVITNNFGAEYGRNNGAVIDVETPSGSNVLHGRAYWFGRYNALGARDFFNHAPDTPQDPYVRNDFGASLGGPLIHNKTFWFGNYEGQRFITALTNRSTVPTDAFKSGIFTFTDSTHPVPYPIDVTVPNAGNNATPLGLDPLMKQILALYPHPSAPGPDDVRGYFFYPSTSRWVGDTFTIRVDHQLSKQNSLFVRYSFNHGTDPDGFHDDFLPGNLGATSFYGRVQAAAIGLTTTLSPQFVNNFRFGANRTNLQYHCTGTSVFDSFGFVDGFGRGADYNLPGISGFGCLALADSNAQARYTGTYQTLDSMTYVRGSHTFKWGGEFRAVYSNGFDSFFSRGKFTFDPFNNIIPTLQNVPSSFLQNSSLVDMVGALLGLVTSQSQNQFFDAHGVQTKNDLRGFRQREMGLYGQDTWKLKPNLTVTAGLRWEWYGVPYEVNGIFSSLFQDPTTAAPDPGFVFTTLSKGKQQIWRDDYKGFDPRIGIAWDPFKNGKTSIRAGYGIFRDRAYGNLVENAKSDPPFLSQFGIFSAGSLSTDFGAPTLVPSSAIVPDFSFLGPTLFDPKFKLPYSQNWNVGVQREVARNLVVEVNYVGVHGIHEFRVVDANPPQPNLVADLLAFCVPTNPKNVYGCDVSTVTSANLWVGDFFGTLPKPAVNNRAFTDSGNGYITGGVLTKSIARSFYHGLQLNVTKRFAHGVHFQGAYTYSHSLDDSSDPISPATGNRSFPRNSFNLGPEYGNSDFDVRHRAVINFVYDPDMGRGKSHASNGFVGRALEGWEIAGIFGVQSGLPYDVFGFQDTQHTGLSDRATIINSSVLHTAPANPSPSSQVFTGLNIAAFANDTSNIPWGVPSNIHRNRFYGPGSNNWDAVLSKDTAVGERVKFELRFEFYNLFNHPHFEQPGNLLSDPSTFGFSSSQVGRSDGTTGARQIQFAAKLKF